MSIHNLTRYKQAKYLVKDLEVIIPILYKTYESLKPYMKYRPIIYILDAIHDNRLILEIHLDKEKRILKNKGEE